MLILGNYMDNKNGPFGLPDSNWERVRAASQRTFCVLWFSPVWLIAEAQGTQARLVYSSEKNIANEIDTPHEGNGYVERYSFPS